MDKTWKESRRSRTFFEAGEVMKPGDAWHPACLPLPVGRKVPAVWVLGQRHPCGPTLPCAVYCAADAGGWRSAKIWLKTLGAPKPTSSFRFAARGSPGCFTDSLLVMADIIISH